MSDSLHPAGIPKIAVIAVIALIALHFTLAFTSARIKSPTIDEYTYIASGYYYVKTGDFRLDRTHPPLMRLLIGLPLQFLTLTEPDPQVEKWDQPISYELGYSIGKEMLLRKENPLQPILLAARLPVILLSCGLALLIYLWATELYGIAGGLTALFLYALCPNMLAHARLATLDLGISFFFVLSLYTLYRYTKSPTLWRLVFTGLAWGAALATKVTALLLFPVFIATLFWMLLQPGQSLRGLALRELALWRLTPRAFPWLAFLKQTGILILSSLLLLFLIYGFPFKPFYYWDTLHNVIAKSLDVGKGGASIPGMPHRHYAFFLWGHYSTSGWPYYYMAAAAVKTPLTIFAALGFFLLAGSRRWRGLPDGLLVGTILLIHGLAAMNRVNIGLRHVLPFYPLLYIYMARIIEFRNRRVYSIILIGLGIGYAASCAFIYPDFLAYFNEAAGGANQGHRYLDDSNLDWGQDLGRLAKIKEIYPNEPLYIAQEYIFDPAAFGFSAIQFKQEQIPQPPNGIVAISKQWAIRHRVQPRSPYYFDWLEKYPPIGHIGHTIWLFRFESNPKQSEGDDLNP